MNKRALVIGLFIAVLASVISQALLHGQKAIATDAALYIPYFLSPLFSLLIQATSMLAWAVPMTIVGTVVATLLGPSLNAMALGEEMMTGLGGAGRRTRLLGFGAVVLLCGAATAAAGPIAFLGLAVPHGVRRLVGPDWRRVVPCSALAGAVLLVLADVAGRLLLRPGELEVGVVAALLGAPVLVALVARPRRTA